MHRFAGFFTFLFVVLFTVQVWANALTPEQQIIKEAADKTLAQLKIDKDKIDAEPKRVYALIDNIVLPYFNFERMSKLVLGKNWRNASDVQQQRFVAEFRQLLVRTYATSLVKMAGDGVKIDYLPVKIKKRHVVVDTEVTQGNNAPVAVEYWVAKKDQKVFNVIAEGVSLVNNYRTEFNDTIRKMGFEGLINDIKSRNEDAFNK